MKLTPRSSALSALLALLAGAATAQTGPVVSQGKFLPPDTILPKTLFRVAVDGSTALASYVDADDVGSDKGAVHVIERQPSGLWTQTGKLLPGDPSLAGQFGNGLDIDGDVAVVGDDTSVGDYGRIWVYRRSAGTWSQEATLFPPYPFPGIGCGSALGLSGSTLVVGAYRLFVSGLGLNTGAIFFYENSGTSWGLAQGPIFASDKAGASAFGEQVAIDGDRVVVNAKSKQQAYVFERATPGGGWSEVAKLTHPGPVGSGYGNSIAIAGDWVAVGAPMDDQKANNAGAVFLYERQPSGTWTLNTKLMASDGLVGDQFGTSAAMTGTRLIVGAFGVAGSTADAGAVYVYERQAGGTWSPIAKLMDPVAALGDNYGLQIALGGDGAIAATSPGDDDVALGLGTVFFYDAETLSSDVASVSLSQGGAQPFDLQAGVALAGQLHLVVGSVSGTAPGTPLAGGLLMPLNYDGYTAYTLSSPNQPPLSHSLGVLGAGGGAQASFALPAGSDPGLVGVIANHAFVALNLAAGAAVTLASNAKSVVLVP